MYAVSDRFLQAITESHDVAVEVILVRTDGTSEALDITGGSVAVDRSSSVRRTCTVTLADPTLIPRTAADKISIYGARLRISRGVQYADGSQELVPLGVFRIDSVSGDVDEGPVTIAGKGLEAVIADDRFTTPYRASGTAVSAVTSLIQRSIPAASVVIGSLVDVPIGARTWDVGADPWAAVGELASVVGAEVHADGSGAFVMAELPDILTTSPVWTVSAGEGGTYVQASRGMSSDGVFNGVLGKVESTESGGAPAQVLVVDSDPGSPTYWDGPYGHRLDPQPVSSPAILTSPQATAAATLRLRQMQAGNASADLATLPNPALECGDILRVVYADGTAELHQVSAFPVPLDVGGSFTIRTISAKEAT
ncbi:DUF5047 domain-containing protein [Streptomyces xanthophaeus]|uniref:DUF5047 domain-containing protein n=1 Tax=Streptomyces xanthophaeus TaxID=67385 RepID=UPI00371BF789